MEGANMSTKTTGKDAAWKHGRRAAWRNVADEAVILDVETAVYYSLDGAGRRMWELLGDGRTAAQIGEIVAREHDADESRILKDLHELIAKLLKERLLERA
jgi:hypothetical protein